LINILIIRLTFIIINIMIIMIIIIIIIIIIISSSSSSSSSGSSSSNIVALTLLDTIHFFIEEKEMHFQNVVTHTSCRVWNTQRSNI